MPTSALPFTWHDLPGAGSLILTLDVGLLALGIGATILAWRRLSNQIGHGITFASVGLMLLAVVPIIETALDFAGVVSADSNELLHRLLGSVGFIWLLVGLRRVGLEMVTERREKNALIAELSAAAKRHAQLAAIIEATTDFIGIFGVDQRAIYLNAGGRALLGIAAEADVTHSSIYDYHPGWAFSLVQDDGVPTALRDGIWHGESALLAQDGREIPVSQLIIAHRDADGTVQSLSTIARDISERKALERRLQELASVVEATPDFVVTLDRAGDVSYVNRAVRELLGLPEDDESSVPTQSVLDRIPGFAREMMVDEALSGGGRNGSWTGESAMSSNNGYVIPVSLSVVAHRDARGELKFISMVGRDITAQKDLENQLRHQAFHDPLTGLANRARFTDRLEHALTRAKRTAEQVAVLFIDLDEFKMVNDSYGHAAGDALLVAVGERLAAQTRSGDTLARLGGDEFAIILDGTSDREHAEGTAERIVESLRVPFRIGDIEVLTRASVGVALATGGETVGELLRRADLAMYASKAGGKNRTTTFDESIQSELGERMALMNELQGALQHNEFVLHYQPTVDIESGRVTGAEALVRWRHPVRGLIPPMTFIPLMETSGSIVELGRWVLAEACRQLATWHRAGNPDMTIAVNVAARQLQEADFVDAVRTALVEFGVPPTSLTIEITESATMRDVAATVRVLAQLKGLGVRLAIDDFGTGYSSLSHLRQFPFDILKIDKSFVDAISTSGFKLTSAIVSMAKGLGLEIVAEGVERTEQLEVLRRLACDTAQGYLISRPVPAAEFEALLRPLRDAAA